MGWIRKMEIGDGYREEGDNDIRYRIFIYLFFKFKQ